MLHDLYYREFTMKTSIYISLNNNMILSEAKALFGFGLFAKVPFNLCVAVYLWS